MGNTTATYMCTHDYCPCPTLNLSQWNETRANHYMRTANVVNTNASNNYTPFYFGVPNVDTIYNSFYDCYQNLQNSTNSTKNQYL